MTSRIPALHLLRLTLCSIAISAMFDPVPNAHAADILIMRVPGENSIQDLPCGTRTKSTARTGAELRSYHERVYRRYKQE